MLPGLEKIVVTEYQKAKLRENANELLIMQSLQVAEKKGGGGGIAITRNNAELVRIIHRPQHQEFSRGPFLQVQ